ncbi:MAG TPA: CAP domain-containing protein [Actinomycetes bacterium]|nr:CAP domain-containing protein [Actinomycetes bacterium]
MPTVVARQDLPRRVLSVLVTVLVALGLVAALPGRALAGPSEGSFFSAVNSARAANGLPALAYASDLASVARRQAERMASSNRLYHNPNLGSEVSSWQIVAENVGYGPTWSAVQQAFMASPDHRANILDPKVTQLGVGTAVGNDGRIWVAQVFRLPYGATAPSSSSGTGSTSSGWSSGAATSSALSSPAPLTPEQLLRQRIATARAKVSGGKTAGKDPLVKALAFSSVMATVGR